MMMQQANKHRFLFLPDLHVPFTDLDLLERTVNETKGVMNHLVIGGDFFDCYDLSAYLKEDCKPFLEEYMQAQEIFDTLCSCYPNVTVLQGNHEARFERNILPKIPKAFIPFVGKPLLDRLVDGERFNPKTRLWEYKKPLKNVAIPRTQLGGPHWYVKYGSVIFAHPERSRKAGGASAEIAYNFFTHDRGIITEGVFIGHVHRLNIQIRNHAILVEGGCIAKNMSYVENAKMCFSEGSPGYSYVTLDREGHIIPQETGIRTFLERIGRERND